ncbi:MAG: Gfo/Idh/MocA family oxidoreductase [Lentisphaeria bacterium]|nr:Gfo/Idh/MocA family oxidoreductase [Lentisphaeria bacterium]
MIRLGLYGCGERTWSLLNSLIRDEFYCVQASFDLSEAAVQKTVAEFGGKACRSAEELIACKDVDAFLISLSPFAHADAMRKTIPAGKPVFVEKPVAFTGAEVAELEALAEQYHVPVQVGFMRRYLPETIAALDYIRNNDPGRLFSVECKWVHHGDVGMNYYMQHFPDNFRLKCSQIPFHCCHMLDIFLLFGGPVQTVTSQLIKVTERPYPSPDDVICSVKFANGANGLFHYSSMVYYTEFSYGFNAENYSFKMCTEGQNLQVYHRPRFRTTQLGPHPEAEKDFGRFNNRYERACFPDTTKFSQGLDFANENIMFDFVKMVRDGAVPEADLKTAVRVQGLAEAVEMSGKLGKTIELNEQGIPIYS